MTESETNAVGGHSLAVVVVLLAGTVLSLAGTDLILPVVPSFPALFHSTPAVGQYLLAAYVAGFAFGLFGFGWLADFWPRRHLLMVSAVLFAAAALAAAWVQDAHVIVTVRAIQGFGASAPAVFGPAIIKSMFSEVGATRALGAMGSIESLAPALAPIGGLALFRLGGWDLPFIVLGGCGLALVVALLAIGRDIPQRAAGRRGSYAALLRTPDFIRYGCGYAACLAGLLVFVFSGPAVIVGSLGGTPVDFITMQITGICGYILAANLAGPAVHRFGAERVIFLGTVLSLAGALCIALYGLAGGTRLLVLYALFLPFNLGLGLRGPPGFLRAIMAGEGNDDRAASLVILMAMGLIAVGTAAIAPFVELGLAPPAAVSVVLLAFSTLASVPRHRRE